ncbi:MAG TPA: rhamnulokinase family protein [Capsulimonadaceae bacterium]|nr:rhamnulokinase family protein [Capsulimonadaceae bacterium]
MKQYLAIDLGAESGRGILAGFDGERITLKEIGRFVTTRGQEDIGPDGVRRWDFERIWSEIDNIYRQALAESGGQLVGVGADSWGVDFGLLDDHGALLEQPMHYRNTANVAAMDETQSRVPAEAIWQATGIQFMPFNTLYQLVALQNRAPKLLDSARRLLFIPDLVHNRLTAGKSLTVERTDASTSQFLDPRTRDWHMGLLQQVGLPSHFLGPLVDAGSKAGETPEGVPVCTPGTHDTAAAVTAVPAEPDAKWAFLSSGTWSLLGAQLDQPILSKEALEMGLSNEAGVGNTVRLLKNIMGLWLVQECRRSLKAKEGREYSYAELTMLAKQAPAGGSLIDAAHTRFLAPPDMIEEIRASCQDTGQPAPDNPGAIVRCCLESLALAYQRTLRDLETLLGAKFDALHIVGGGSNNRLLNQWTADACGIPVLAGPGEATALGNVLGQLVGAGEAASWQQARQISRQSFTPETFEPTPGARDTWLSRASSLDT